MRLIILFLLLLPSLAGFAQSEKSSALAGSLQAILSPAAAEEELLPPDEAFRMQVKARDGQTLVAEFTPAKGYYFYRDKFQFSLGDGAGSSIAAVTLPAGKLKDDPLFGTTEVYFQPGQALITLAGGAAGERRLKLNATYQGCNEPIGVCYPPISKSFDLLVPAALAAGGTPPAASGVSPVSESDQVAGLLKQGSFWLIVASFVGFGLLLAFTPCVFPMVPILSGIIAGQGQHMTRIKGFTLALAYVLGMAITYAVAGVFAGLSGAMLSAALQTPWVLGGFAVVFVLLALSMFGFYELQLPAALQIRLAETSNRLGGGHYAGVFVMGVLSAVIVGPCVAAPLAGALLYISQTRDVVLGGSALFAMALGMGLPLLLVGASAGELLPRAGAWMDAVKRFFGVLLLGVAIYLISPVIPAVLHMLLWAALLIVSAIYLHAIDPLPAGASGYRKLWKGVGVIALLLGVALLTGALSGGRDVLQPLSGLRPAGGAAEAAAQPGHLPFQRVKNLAELESRVQGASGRYVMLDFYADWCVSCKEMERFTLSDARVKSKLADVVLLQADVTANSADDAVLLKRFGLFGPPGILFFDRQGNEIQGVRVIGFQDAERFLQSLGAALQ